MICACRSTFPIPPPKTTVCTRKSVDALLALAGGRFTRREFFKLTLNPCFLAAQKISRDDVMQWLDWADRLNIFREFDAGTRADLRPFSWRHALRRLRLGRIMTTGPTIAAYQSAVPFGDLRSADPEAVTRFSAVVERLARFCERCTIFSHGGSSGPELLQDALKEFVAVPEDRGEEEGVRSELLRALSMSLSTWMRCWRSLAPRPRAAASPIHCCVNLWVRVSPTFPAVSGTICSMASLSARSGLTATSPSA